MTSYFNRALDYLYIRGNRCAWATEAWVNSLSSGKLVIAGLVATTVMVFAFLIFLAAITALFNRWPI